MEENKLSVRPDVQAIKFETLDWSDEKKMASLDTVFQYATNHAEIVIQWYLSAKKAKKHCALFLRVTTIVLTALAALIPVVSEMSDYLSPLWSTFALGGAALCVAFDRFFGCSNAWMRYMVTEHQVRQLLHAFQIEREELKVDWEPQGPNKDQVILGLKEAKKFIVNVDEIVRIETEQWRAEFQSIIKEINSAANNNKNSR